jgi:hypothetical protein
MSAALSGGGGGGGGGGGVCVCGGEGGGSLSQKPYQVRVAACAHGMASYMQYSQVHTMYRDL